MSPRLCRFSQASAWASNTALGKLALVRSMMIYMRIVVMMMMMIMALILVSLKEIYIYTLTMMIFPGHADNIHKLTIARLDSGDAAILVTASGARTFTLKVLYHCHHYCHHQHHCHYHYYFTIMTKIIIVIITKIMTQITIVAMKKIMTIMMITIAIMIIMTIRARLPA